MKSNYHVWIFYGKLKVMKCIQNISKMKLLSDSLITNDENGLINWIGLNNEYVIVWELNVSIETWNQLAII